MTRPARVVLVRSSQAIYEPRVLKELRMFTEAGFDATLLCWDRERTGLARERRDGYAVARFRLRAPYGSKWLFALMPLWWLYVFWFLAWTPPNVVHAADFDTVLPALAAAFLRRFKVVYDIYDFYAARNRTVPRLFRPVLLAAERACARLCNAVIIVDPARKYLLGKRIPRRLVVAMNCPYDEVQPDWRKKQGQPLTVFYAGVITSHRGLKKLARVTRGLEGIRVLVAGRVVNREYEELFREPRFTYLGVLDYQEALRYTFEADAVYAYYDPALEINRTANPTKMYDAFMCSTAVLVNSEPPATAPVSEHQCGSRLPYGDDDALRKTLQAWRDNRAEPLRMGANGRALFDREFNWRTQAEAILGVYHELGLG